MDGQNHIFHFYCVFFGPCLNKNILRKHLGFFDAPGKFVGTVSFHVFSFERQISILNIFARAASESALENFSRTFRVWECLL